MGLALAFAAGPTAAAWLNQSQLEKKLGDNKDVKDAIASLPDDACGKILVDNQSKTGAEIEVSASVKCLKKPKSPKKLDAPGEVDGCDNISITAKVNGDSLDIDTISIQYGCAESVADPD
jgi:hypothetical protein